MANLYLHYVFDLWVLSWRKKHASGEMYVVRYADDFVMVFQKDQDAMAMRNALAERALLTQVQKRKAAFTDKPRATKPAAGAERTRAVPAALRRDVWTRDRGRCAFVGVDGHRCNETRRLEYAHLKPWARGGEHSAANVALRCAAHNALEAERDYGAEFMAGKRKRE